MTQPHVYIVIRYKPAGKASLLTHDSYSGRTVDTGMTCGPQQHNIDCEVYKFVRVLERQGNRVSVIERESQYRR